MKLQLQKNFEVAIAPVLKPCCGFATEYQYILKILLSSVGKNMLKFGSWSFERFVLPFSTFASWSDNVCHHSEVNRS